MKSKSLFTQRIPLGISGLPDRQTVLLPDCRRGLTGAESRLDHPMKTQTNTRTMGADGGTAPKRKSNSKARGATGVMDRDDSQPRASYDEVAARAHAIWLAEGCPEGREKEHWQKAEEQLQGGAMAGAQF
jgi:hypothetical protein